MSADNWGVCPYCEDRHQRDIKNKEAELKKSYGKVSEQEYSFFVEALALLKREQVNSNLREDYEFFTDGYDLNIVYGSSCKECGKSFSFKKTIDIRTSDEKQ